MSSYSKANTTAQRFSSRYPGSRIKPNCGVIHTTEGFTWPGYGGGATAPTYTVLPDIQNKRLFWRAHFPDEMSARALRNEKGGVNTNTANCIQIELIGTCDYSKRNKWGVRKAGEDYIYWPDAPQWALDGLADFIADANKRHGIPIEGVSNWITYGPDDRVKGRLPASYGAHPFRMSFAQWRQFKGWCGHQHVPENDHGDPGSLDWAYVEAKAKAIRNGTPVKPVAPGKPTKPAPVKPPSRGYNVDAALKHVNQAVVLVDKSSRTVGWQKDRARFLDKAEELLRAAQWNLRMVKPYINVPKEK